jgi:broad specificity phosphatase PhoE
LSASASPTRLYLVRHGETAEGGDGRCGGRTDRPLSDAGRASAECLAATFAGLGLAAVYSSPLGRAMATAQPIAAAAGVEPVYVDGLAELDFGAFEGRTFAEIAATDLELYERWMAAPTTVRFPGGEWYADLKARAVTSVGDIVARHRGRSVLAVSHGGPIRAIVADLLEIPDRAVFRIDVALASVTLIDLWDGRPLLRALNWGIDRRSAFRTSGLRRVRR